MRSLIKAQSVNLSLWNCHVEGDVFSANGEKLDNDILMVYYFNIGLDASVGLEVERNRKRYRCCNYLLYGYFGLRNWLFSD